MRKYTHERNHAPPTANTRLAEALTLLATALSNLPAKAEITEEPQR